jgi:hypothetical protein
MTTNSLQLNTSTPWAGLGTATYTVVSAGAYTITALATLPFAQGTYNNTQAQSAVSGLSIVINQNGTPIVSVGGTAGNNPSPTQPEMSCGTTLTCAAGDVITVVLSSSQIADNTPNAVKASLNLFLAS